MCLVLWFVLVHQTNMASVAVVDLQQQKLVHSKRLLLALYPLDSWHSIHSSLVSPLVHTSFSARVFVCLEFTIDQLPDVFVDTDIFRERFERLFRHSIPHAHQGQLAQRCRTLFLRGVWSSACILRVLRVLDAPLRVLCLHAIEQTTTTMWKQVASHAKFKSVCADHTELLLLSVGGRATPTCLPLLHQQVWAKLHTLVLYDCSAMERYVAEWICEHWRNLPALKRVYVLGVQQAPRASDWKHAHVHIAPVTKLGASEPWPLSRIGAQDYVVTCDERVLPPAPVSLKPADTDEKRVPALVLSTAAADTIIHEPVASTLSASTAGVQDEDTHRIGIRDVLQQMEEQRRRDTSLHRQEQRQRQQDAMTQNKALLKQMLENTSRHVRSRQHKS